MKSKLSFLSVLLLIALVVFGFRTDDSVDSNKNSHPNPSTIAPRAPSIEWLSIEDAFERCKKTPKKIFINIHTNWCGPCKMMDANIFSDYRVIDYMNENYYCVKLDGAMKEDVYLMDTWFRYDSQKKAHSLAWSLGAKDDELKYPTFVFMDDELSRITLSQGMRNLESMLTVLEFIGDDNHLSMTYAEFEKKFDMSEHNSRFTKYVQGKYWYPSGGDGDDIYFVMLDEPNTAFTYIYFEAERKLVRNARNAWYDDADFESYAGTWHFVDENSLKVKFETYAVPEEHTYDLIEVTEMEDESNGRTYPVMVVREQ